MMSYDARLTLLSTHADRLNQGGDAADRFLRKQGPLPPDLVALLTLARRLKRALAPVPPRDGFRTQLRHELAAHGEWNERRQWRSGRKPLFLSLAAVGSVLPLLGIVVWRRRRRSSGQPLLPNDPARTGEPYQLPAPMPCDKMHTR